MLNTKIKYKIEKNFQSKITNITSVSGGCISNAYKVSMGNGEEAFLKTNSSVNNNMFITEAHGLRELKTADVIKIPKVFYFAKEFILLENVNSSGKQNDFFEDFGRKFAMLHKFNGDYFGFYEDNYIGSNPQINIPIGEEKSNWCLFYFNKRLSYQFDLAEQLGNSTSELQKVRSKLENRIEGIIGTNDEKPSLLHGDLWGGNYIIDENGFACLIDPAVYYGNREADLAMTKLFGGFNSEFYSAYNEVYPFADGYEYRENIYKLYHILNHLNLFGSGYYSQCISLANYYL